MSKTYKGIDISEYQKIVNWNKVAKQIDFLILRAGYGNTISQKDKMFESHIKGAVQAGIKNIGIYYFSYARSIKEAEKEANVCLDIINPYKKNINMPIAFDWEDDSYRYCIKYKITPTRKLCDSMATAFCKVIEKAGYQSMLYTNPNYLSQFFTRSKYKHLWVAQYFSKCQIANVDIWQYTDKGRINGISGNVDMDYCYNSAIMAPVSTVKAQIANKNSVLRDAAHLEAKNFMQSTNRNESRMDCR